MPRNSPYSAVHGGRERWVLPYSLARLLACCIYHEKFSTFPLCLPHVRFAFQSVPWIIPLVSSPVSYSLFYLATVRHCNMWNRLDREPTSRLTLLLPHLHVLPPSPTPRPISLILSLVYIALHVLPASPFYLLLFHCSFYTNRLGCFSFFMSFRAALARFPFATVSFTI